MVDIDALKDVALRYEGAWEDYPFGPDDCVIKAANGRMFALLSQPGPGRAAVTVKSTPDEAEEALMLPFIRPAPYLARHAWVAVDVANEAEFDIACAYIRRSYELVAPLKPARARKRG
ncbi:MAG: MmcQ/YjbR family DNA-binding protein [Dehalococcoidia bacterium]|nr:MmcQ/YjbR family DNA-binding protein [Dehalococcoidia bacterium]